MRLFKYIHIVVLLTIFCFSTLCFADGGKEKTSIIKFGIFPYLNSVALFTLWDPMRIHLEKNLKQKILFETAPDYKTFVQRSSQGQYNFIITAAHFARLGQRDSGLIPLLAPKAKLFGIFVVKENSPIHSLADLKGKTIATPDPLAVITVGGIKTLKKIGITTEDISIKSFPSHNSAIMSVQRNQFDAGLCSVKAFNVMRQTTKVNLRVVGETDRIPYPVILMAHPTKEFPKVQAVKYQLIDFFNYTEQGIKFVQKKSYIEMIMPMEAELTYFDPMLTDLRKLIYEETD
ncbi:MAG: phosphate/phosphite/phosphonate ABC transporter substrate-binding protein [Desulfobacteraceae bacterium]|nr:phosphate/phosphite/phosphonate ABC transporter substrate-binding protein [Desulfobacteraceae bacterium]